VERLTIYYCDVEGEDDPFHKDYITNADSDQLALMIFRNRHGPFLLCVYDETFRLVWERPRDAVFDWER
jgi:hypothetical protein